MGEREAGSVVRRGVWVRVVGGVVAGVLLVGVAGCSDPAPVQESPSPEEMFPAPSGEPEPPPEPTPTEDPDVAAIEDVFARYIDAIVTMQNEQKPDAALLYGVAGEEVVIDEMQKVLRYVDMGLRRVGAPEVGEPQVTVDGDTARLEVCINEDTWTAEVDSGAEIVGDPLGSRPRVYALTQSDDGWMVTALLPQDSAVIVC